jgi:hypothetical protein
MSEAIDRLPKGHPVSIYFQEKNFILNIINELTEANPEIDFQKFYNIFNQFATIEKRFVLKECGHFTTL